MKTLEIKAQKRDELGKKNAVIARRNELVPCVLYGGNEIVHLEISEKELKPLVYSPEVFFAKIDVGGSTYTGVLKDIQFHPVTDSIMHIDFLEVVDGKPLKVALPVKVTGNSAGVRAGGKLVVNVRKLRVEAKPENMPDEITIDISDLNIGDVLRISNLDIPNVTFLEAANVVIAGVRMTRNAKSAQAAAEADKK